MQKYIVERMSAPLDLIPLNMDLSSYFHHALTEEEAHEKMMREYAETLKKQKGRV